MNKQIFTIYFFLLLNSTFSFSQDSLQQENLTTETKKTDSNKSESIWNKTETYKDIFILLSPFLVLIWTTYKERSFNKEKHKRDVELIGIQNTHQIKISEINKKNQENIDKLKHQQELEKKEFEQNLSLSKSSDSEQKECSKKIHSSLTKMLFKVQNVHLKFSTSCSDYNCLEDEISKLEKGIEDCFENISDQMAFANSGITSNVYSFLQFLGLLINELKLIKEGGEEEFKKAHPSVFIYSSKIASHLIDIQKIINELDTTNEIEIREEELQSMMDCCGDAPSNYQLQEYCNDYPEPREIKNQYLNS